MNSSDVSPQTPVDSGPVGVHIFLCCISLSTNVYLLHRLWKYHDKSAENCITMNIAALNITISVGELVKGALLIGSHMSQYRAYCYYYSAPAFMVSWLLNYLMRTMYQHAVVFRYRYIAAFFTRPATLLLIAAVWLLSVAIFMLTMLLNNEDKFNSDSYITCHHEATGKPFTFLKVLMAFNMLAALLIIYGNLHIYRTVSGWISTHNRADGGVWLRSVRSKMVEALFVGATQACGMITVVLSQADGIHPNTIAVFYNMLLLHHLHGVIAYLMVHGNRCPVQHLTKRRRRTYKTDRIGRLV